MLPSPASVDVTASGAPLLPGGWTNSSALAVSVRSAAGVVSGLDAEVRPQSRPFTGAPTAHVDGHAQSRVACAPASKCSTGSVPAVTVHVPDGTYHLQVRLHNGQGVSPWRTYAGMVRVDTHPPTAPSISSPTDPDPHRLYHSSAVRLSWSSADSGSGVAGYSYRLDTSPGGAAARDIRTPTGSVSLTGLETGQYYFHARALDHAGNWGPDSTFPMRIDVTPPGLAHVRFSQYQFDPLYDRLGVSFAVTRRAGNVHVGVYRSDTHALVRLFSLGGFNKGQSTAVSWDGRDAHGNLVPGGSYDIYVRATDQYGHSSLTGWRDFVVNYQRIVVSLSHESLTAYDGNHVFLTSLVTTGNPALPTPTGTFHVMARFHPYTFISPWPRSSPYYYKPSKVQYALLFREGGYFIHDAPWRTAFGPGTNAQTGTPGTNLTGTHGCINVPPDVAARLYAWAQIGTVVEVDR